MDNYRYGLTSTLELLLLVGQYYLFFFSNSFYIDEINLNCLYHAYRKMDRKIFVTMLAI